MVVVQFEAARQHVKINRVCEFYSSIVNPIPLVVSPISNGAEYYFKCCVIVACSEVSSQPTGRVHNSALQGQVIRKCHPVPSANSFLMLSLL